MNQAGKRQTIIDMGDTLKALRALSDPTRLRIVALLGAGELSVNEMQEVTRLGQSRISTHLGLLTEAGLVVLRKDGRRSFYGLSTGLAPDLEALVRAAAKGATELPERDSDEVNLRRVLALREERAQAYFNHVAGRFDRVYGPGRSWQALGHLLLRMLPPLDVADLGSGEGLVAEMLARSCRRVIAVDNSERMVEFGSRKARENGMTNLEFRLGDILRPPIDDASMDVAILSHALHHAEDPAEAVRAAHRILRPGGRLLVLDLLQHRFEQARERYGDRWLGFAPANLQRWLEQAGFDAIEVSVVSREEDPPHFETLLAAGVKREQRPLPPTSRTSMGG